MRMPVRLVYLEAIGPHGNFYRASNFNFSFCSCRALQEPDQEQARQCQKYPKVFCWHPPTTVDLSVKTTMHQA